MSWIQEFKTFALKGNMVDLAIGVVIGTAFGRVVSSLVSDIIMPPIGLLLGGVDFSKLAINLHIPGMSHAPVELKYGTFVNTLVDFFIIAFVIFAVMKLMNRLRLTGTPEVPAAPTTKECPECMMSIPIGAKKCGHCCSPLTSSESSIQKNPTLS